MSVILHGGAGKLQTQHVKRKLPFLRKALDAAWEQLCDGKPGEFAVAAALRVMEGCEFFNAGFGGYPNINGVVLLDIGLMRGTRDFVSLLNVRRVKYPSAIVLDMLCHHRTLMTIWTHELMEQVNQAPLFIRERYGWVRSHEDLIAPYVKKLMQERKALEVSQDGGTHGTVGCVVRDANGKLFSGTSTGGVSFKYNGRIGDTPIIGSGVFADDDVCALSTTGHGESFLLSMLSGYIIAAMRQAQRKQEKVFEKSPKKLTKLLRDEIDEMSRKANKRGGAIIVIPRRGEPCYALNSEMVSLGVRTGSCASIEQDDAFILCQDGSRIT